MDKPLIFISCGQYTQDEIDVGNRIAALVTAETNCEPYFAEQQNTLEGLVTNILGALGRCVGFVGVLHHRGSVNTPTGQIERGSLWVEQELAIAAFVQHVLKRDLQVVLYVRKGITREGIRQQLRLKPIEFESEIEVVNDFAERVKTWNTNADPTRGLAAEWVSAVTQISGERHDYILHVDLVNRGQGKVEEWRVEVDFPRQFLEGAGRRSRCRTYRKDESQFAANGRRLYQGDRLRILDIDYFVDRSNWPGERPRPLAHEPTVQIRVWSGETGPWKADIPMAELEQF